MAIVKGLAAAAVAILLLAGGSYMAASWSVNRQLESAARHVSGRTTAPTVEPSAAGSGGSRKIAGRRDGRSSEN